MVTLLKYALAVFFFILSCAAFSKTLYVEKWGAPGAACGSRSVPCDTIQEAIDNASERDKIVVGPGVYFETLDIDKEGLKLESIAGRYGTIIDTSGLNDTAVFITVSKCQFGKKRKGFTIVDDGITPSDFDGIVIDSSTQTGCKIDSNRVVNFDEAIVIKGEKHQVRNNIVSAIGGAGISCDECIKVLIQDNLLINDTDNPDGILLQDADNTMVYRNRMLGFRGTTSFSDGIYADVTSESNRLRDNVVERTQNDGVDMRDLVGSELKGNILNNIGINGFRLVQDEVGKAPKIQDNLAVFVGPNSPLASEGFDLRGLQSARFTGNTVVQSRASGIILHGAADSTFSSFKNNNTTNSGEGSGPGCGITNENSVPMTYGKHFFGDASGSDPDEDNDGHDGDPNTTGCSTLPGVAATGSSASKPNPFKARRAAGL
jgi:hypothetical protein